MATYYVLGLEPFKMAEVYGIHSDRKIAKPQADALEKNKHPLCCQTYVVKSETEVNREKWELFT